MNNANKGKSPFYPGQPVPIQFFAGRQNEINRISRSAGQVALGKPQAIFLAGEYGIGKSSLAGFTRFCAEKENDIIGIHVLLGGSSTINDVATKTLESVIKSQIYETKFSEKIRNLLSKYIGKQELFGFGVNLDAIRADGPNISQGYLPFLTQLFDRVKGDGVKGIMLILDELNGITENPKFAHFIKSLVDENALSQTPLPLLLMLCGVDERRREMIGHHQPIERIFDVVEIKPMDDEEMIAFFNKAFGAAGITIEDDAMKLLCKYSAGFPKIMHIIGDAVFWLDKDDNIDKADALHGIVFAADEIGKKFVDQQVYKALHSEDYHSILTKLGKDDFDLVFKKSDIEKGLSAAEKKKFNNFLQRMKKLKVLKSGKELGEYEFTSRLVRLYIRLNPLIKS